jgi:hypothetical protein
MTARLAKIALAAFTACAGAGTAQAQTAPPLTMNEYETVLSAFRNMLDEQVSDAGRDVPRALGAAECYTLNDGINVQLSYLHAGLVVELFEAVPMTGGKIQNVDGEDMPLSEHFADVAAFTRKFSDVGVIPGNVAIGCYKTAAEAVAVRDALNRRQTHAALMRARGEMLPRVQWAPD